MYTVEKWPVYSLWVENNELSKRLVCNYGYIKANLG